MRASKELIDAFRKTADYLEEYPDNYSHMRFSSCLIVTLIYVNTLYTKNDISNIMYEADVANYSVYGPICESTGLPLNEIYTYLYNLGITSREDLEEIEYPLGDTITPTVENAIEYFRTKANKLEVQLLSSNKNSNTNIIIQSVR